MQSSVAKTNFYSRLNVGKPEIIVYYSMWKIPDKNNWQLKIFRMLVQILIHSSSGLLHGLCTRHWAKSWHRKELKNCAFRPQRSLLSNSVKPRDEQASPTHWSQCKARVRSQEERGPWWGQEIFSSRQKHELNLASVQSSGSPVMQEFAKRALQAVTARKSKVSVELYRVRTWVVEGDSDWCL